MSESQNQIARRLCKKYDLQDWHLEFIKLVMLPKAFRLSKWQIIARLGIVESTYYYWIRSPKFNKARRDFMRQYFQDDIPDILMAMKNEAIAGNERAARLFLEYVDEWDKDPRNADPNELPKAISTKEIKIVINQLQQKFYGTNNQEIKSIEATSEPIIEAEL